MNRAVVRVPATSANLGPGFDSLGLALDLYNYVTLDVVARPVEPTVTIRGEGRQRLPRNARNLALRAAQRVLRAASKGQFIAAITLDNAIPVGGGLGSSAAAIIGAMVAVNAILAAPFQPHELLCMALELEPHPDNLAPALFGGLTVAVLATDGRPLVMPLAPPAALKAVVLTPDQSISTYQSRAALPSTVPHADAAYNVGRATLLVASLVAGRYDLLGPAMEDRLHQPYRSATYPAMTDIISAARQAGADGAALSGSGPSILALCSGPTEPVQAAMLAAAAAHGLEARARVQHIVAEGATVVSLTHTR